MSGELYDVVIYDIATRTVDSVVGKDMSLDRGYYNAVKRLDTVRGRLGTNYWADIVRAGTAQKGVVLP